MSAVETGIKDYRQFIGGEWVDAAGGGTFDDRDPFTGEVVARVAGGRARGRAARDRGRGRRVPGLVADAAGGAPGHLPQGRRHPRDAAGTRSSRCSRARPAARSASGCSRCTSCRACSARRPRSPYAPIGQVIPSDTGTFAMGLRRPVGVVGAIAPWNAALILSARSIAAPLALGNTVVLKPSELLAVRRRPALGRDLRRGRAAGRRAEHRHARAGRGRPDRRRARREPARAPAQLHRLDRDRPPARRGGRPEAEARRARARRLQPADRARRRRPRLRRQRDGVRRVPPPGPDLHVGAHDHRRAADRRRVHRAARREDEGPEGRRPEGARHDHRPADQRGARSSSSRTGSTTPSRKGAKVLAGGEAVGPVLPGDAARPTSRRTPTSRRHETFGPVAVDRGRRQRRRGGRPRERDDATGSRRGSSRRTPTAASRSRSRSTPGSSTSTTSRSATSRRCRSAASRTAASGASAARGGRRVHRAPLDHRRRAARTRSRSEWPTIVPLAEAVAELVRDGDIVALEGFTHLIPNAAGHELIRQGRRDLTLVRMTPDVVYDQLIGMGCARKLVFSWGGNPGVGSLHRLRDAVEHGWPAPLELEEHSHAGMAAAYAAGAANLPFGVLRGYAGTDLAARTRVAAVTCPFTGEELAAVPAHPAGRRDHPRAAGRPARERPALGHHRRAEGDGARLARGRS